MKLLIAILGCILTISTSMPIQPNWPIGKPTCQETVHKVTRSCSKVTQKIRRELTSSINDSSLQDHESSRD
jgi:hypothetical protein